MTDLVLGIDGGGTSCRAAVADASGHILGRGLSGAANILTDPNAALANIVDAARAAYVDAGLDPDGIGTAQALLGVAGSNVGDAVHFVQARLPFARSVIESDGLIALEGALGDGDGAVAILGTGTVYFARQAEQVRMIGGWGFTVGDLGSGARLGQALLQESLLAFDAMRPASPLTDTVLAEFDGDPRRIVEFARLSSPGDFGRYAPLVFTFAERGDRVAIALLEASAQAVDAALGALVAGGSRRICLLGGLSALYRPWLSDRHAPLFAEPKADALTGAVALAARRFAPHASPGPT